MSIALLLIPSLISASVEPAAKVGFAAVFGDHMVVQAGRTLPVWGFSEPFLPVTVRLADQTRTTLSDPDGTWRVTFSPLRASSEPIPLEASSGDAKVEVRDVVVGEVWICSGQSNMEWPLSATDHAQEDIASANDNLLRIFTVKNTASDTALQDVTGQWTVVTPASAGPLTAIGYFFAKNLRVNLDSPVGMIDTTWGGTPVEAWTPASAFESRPDLASVFERRNNPQVGAQHRPGYLYDGMVRGLAPFRIRGAIWYQGESNVSRAWQYRTLFPLMIEEWRAAWKQGAFPFYFAQIAPFRYGSQNPENCAELWEAQLHTYRTTPRTGMAVTMDIGNVSDIHPRNKREVGRRLALWALANDYGREVVCSGPLYRSSKIEGSAIWIEFDFAEDGLVASDGKPLTHFVIAGQDRVFHEAKAAIVGSKIRVSSDAVRQPLSVRFAWRDDAVPNLVNRNGLPASPFRTDDWPAVTRENR